MVKGLLARSCTINGSNQEWRRSRITRSSVAGHEGRGCLFQMPGGELLATNACALCLSVVTDREGEGSVHVS
jgi:hypothetical protein